MYAERWCYTVQMLFEVNVEGEHLILRQRCESIVGTRSDRQLPLPSCCLRAHMFVGIDVCAIRTKLIDERLRMRDFPSGAVTCREESLDTSPADGSYLERSRYSAAFVSLKRLDHRTPSQRMDGSVESIGQLPLKSR